MEAAEYVGGALGQYVEEGTHNNRPYYRQMSNGTKRDGFLFSKHNGWRFGSELGSTGTNFLRHPLNSAIPPQSGWQWYNPSGQPVKDRSLSLDWGPLEPCIKVEVSAKGDAARRMDSESLGTYLPTDSWLMGRPVYIKNKGETSFLRVEEGQTVWSISNTQMGSDIFMESGRATVSPADPAAGPSDRFGNLGWSFWADGSGAWQDSMGQITVTCHTQQTRGKYFQKNSVVP